MAAGMTWRLHNSYPTVRLESTELDRFAAAAERLTDGAVRVQVGHDSAYGVADASALDWLAEGAVEMAHLRSSQIQNATPELRGAYVMGAARDIQDHMRALPVLEQVYTRVLREHGIEPLVFLPSAIFTISVFAQGEPVRSLADLRTRKLRVFSTDLEPTFRRLGVNARFWPQPELYEALQRGEFDCTVYPACHTVWSVPLWRVTQHSSYLFPEALPPNVLAVSAKSWNRLADGARAALRRAARDIYPNYLRISLNPNDELYARRNLEAAGHHWHPDFSVADQDEFTASARATWAEYAERGGSRAVENRRAILAAMGV